VRVTVYVPALVYVCDGFCNVDDPPSPNDQTHDVGVFVEESTNWTDSGMVPEVTFATKFATGAESDLLTVIYPVLVIVLLPAALVAVRVTVYVPTLVYVCDGLSVEEVLPSPNDHSHDAGEFVDSSMKRTARGAVPEVAFDANAATGVDTADAGRTNNMLTRRIEKIPRCGIFIIKLLRNLAAPYVQHKVSYA
jgi:hypothetical protein